MKNLKKKVVPKMVHHCPSPVELTKESIKADITAFNKRIEDATAKIFCLPSNVSGWAQRKKVGTEHNRLLTEIDHIKRLRGYAADALREFISP